MKKILFLLISYVFVATTITYAASIEENIAPKGFDKQHEGVEYYNLQQIEYYSKIAECERPVNIFVPKNYDANKKYPVLYLLHGIGGNEWEWFGGAPNEVVSNLVANNQAQDMIIVIPNVRVRHKSVSKAPPMLSIEHFKEFDAFLEEFQTSLKPEIEKRFSIIPERKDHAIAGLSMGGREALHLGLKLCDQFAYIGAFEPAPGLLPYHAEEGLFNEHTLTVPNEWKDSTFVMITKGSQDGVVGQWPQKYAETLKKNNVDPHFVELQGGHDFSVWKESLYRFVKTIFPTNVTKAPDNRDNINLEDGVVLFQLNQEIAQRACVEQNNGKIEFTNDVTRCVITSGSRNAWDFRLGFTLDKSVERNEKMLLQFKARTINAKTESGLGKVRAFFELNQQPYSKSLFRVAEIGLEWKEYSFPIVCVQNQEPGKSSFGLFMGEVAQEIEISDLKLTTFGKDYDLNKLPDTVIQYAGQEPDAPWRKEALERIEKTRKGNLEISVVDQNGAPVPNVKISIHQKRSSFLWGTCVVAGIICQDNENARRYRDFIEQYCEVVVFENDLKWFGWKNPHNRQNVMKALDWFDSKGIAVRGHNLVWPSWRNSDGEWKKLADNPEALRKAVRDHVVDEAAGMKGRVFEWDVVNEPYDNRDIWEILGKKEIDEWFRLARREDPNARLFLNDYGILSAQGLDKRKQDFYYSTLEEILAAGAPLGGIGMQGHFGTEATPPTRVIEIIERFAKLGLPIAVTEHDIDSTNSKYQAEFTRDFMIAVFSCEAVEEFLTWGFWERAHWRPNAAMMTANWELTPIGKVWTELVGKEWRSNLDIDSNDNGKAIARVFCGEYEISVKHGTLLKTVNATVSKEGAKVVVKID